MAVINFARQEIEAKIVYYGPAFSGKTTNVTQVHKRLPREDRGDLHRFETDEERTLYFDYAPIQQGEIAGFKTCFKLFTVPGQVFYQETRRILLQGADGVIFVADSAPDQAGRNLESLEDLEQNLQGYGLSLSDMPLVLQFNKRDLPRRQTLQAMNSSLNSMNAPIVEATAEEGEGVLESLERVMDLVNRRIRDNLAGRKTASVLQATDLREAVDDEEVIQSHMEQIQEVRAEEDRRGMEASQQQELGDVESFFLQNIERAPMDGSQSAPAETSPADSAPPSDPISEVPAPSLAPTAPANKSPSLLPADISEDILAEQPLEIRQLPRGPKVRQGFLPVSLGGYRPRKVLDAKVMPDRIQLEVLLGNERGELSRCSLELQAELVRKQAPPKRGSKDKLQRRHWLLITLALLLGMMLGQLL